MWYQAEKEFSITIEKLKVFLELMKDLPFLITFNLSLHNLFLYHIKYLEKQIHETLLFV